MQDFARLPLLPSNLWPRLRFRATAAVVHGWPAGRHRVHGRRAAREARANEGHGRARCTARRVRRNIGTTDCIDGRMAGVRLMHNMATQSTRTSSACSFSHSSCAAVPSSSAINFSLSLPSSRRDAHNHPVTLRPPEPAQLLHRRLMQPLIHNIVREVLVHQQACHAVLPRHAAQQLQHIHVLIELGIELLAWSRVAGGARARRDGRVPGALRVGLHCEELHVPAPTVMLPFILDKPLIVRIMAEKGVNVEVARDEGEVWLVHVRECP